MPLATLLTLLTTLLVASVVTALTVLGVLRDQRVFRTELRQQADVVLDSLSVTAAEELYHLRADRLAEMAEQLARQEAILAVAFYDRQGHLLADSARPEIRTLEISPVGLRLVDGGDSVQWQPGRLLAGRPVAVAGQIFGAVSVDLSTAAFESKVAEARRQGLLVGALACLLGALLAHLLSRSLVEPLGRLADSTERIAAGDLEARAALSGSLETVSLGRAFNDMVTRLATVQRRLEQTNTELEQRVEERTAELRQEIRERQRTEAELLSAKEAAEAADHAKSRFLANMSHEIRTPLNAVLGVAQLLTREQLSGRQRGYVDTIRRSGAALLRLIEEILDLTKIDAGRVEIVQHPFVLAECVEDVFQVLALSAETKGLKLERRLDESCPESVVGDQGRLGQVLINLLGNAVKFTAEGEIRLEVEAGEASDGEVELRFTLSDTGIGIAEEARRELFEPFTQVDSSLTRRHGGAGLGLAISRQLVELMGGTLELESEPGVGTTFRFNVIVGVLDGPPAADGAPIHPASRPLDLLVAEDNLINQMVIREMLESLGHQVEVVENGRLAVDALADRRFDAVLLDVQMPVMDGLEAARLIEATGPGRPHLIAVTAHASAKDREACFEAGMDDYVSKPLKLENLERALRQLSQDSG